MWGWLQAIVQGLIAPFLQWWQTYDQGRNAEQAKSSQAAAQQSADIAAAQSAVKPVTVDSNWLHRGSDAQSTTNSTGPTGPPPTH